MPTRMADRRNVELKAHDPDPAATRAAALAHGAADAGLLEQRDTYFAVASGRLKLREERSEAGAAATLIAYAREDAARARTSAYRLVEATPGLREALAETAGETLVVAKRRRLLLWEGVRIHLDAVEGLGDFVELEAVAPDASDLRAEHARVATLRDVLGIVDDRVVAQGYAQLLQAARGEAARGEPARGEGVARPSPGGEGSAATSAAAATPAAPADLVEAALAVRGRAYVPYSRFPVGAALRDEDGRVHAAANVENAAYPQGQCAEASAIGTLVAAGGHRITEVAVAADAPLITPCGGCRQRLSEFGAADTPVHLCGPEGARRTVTLGALLPLAFDAEDMA